MPPLSWGRNAPILALVLLVMVVSTAPARAELFGKQESPFVDLRPFPKWTDMLKRYGIELGNPPPPCSSRDYDFCHYPEWNRFIEQMRPLSRDKQLDEVNRFFNASPYTIDLVNWGVSDYWATPGQFLSKSGDCEDYAIIKYMSLRNLGWAVSDLRIVVLEDQNLKIVHTVLAVALRGSTLILDNQITVVTDERRIRHYRPIYAVNEEGWWRFH